MVSINRSAPESVRSETSHQQQASADNRQARHGQPGKSWAQWGVVALAASGLAGQAAAELTPFSQLNTRSNPHRQGGLKKLPTALKPGHATQSLVARPGAAVVATPGFDTAVDAWYGVSNGYNTAGQAKTAHGGRRLLGLTPFGGGGSPPATPPTKTPPAPASTPSSSPGCSGPTPPQPSPSPSGNIVTAQLQGCPMSDYSAPVNVGGQAFLAIADTGSTSFGVVSSNCNDCGTQTSYKPGSSATDDKKKVEADYGRGMWLGELTNDKVAFAGGPAANIAFGAIYNQTDWLSGNFCDLTANNPGAPINQGIMGLGGPDLLLNGTDSWVEKTNASFAYPAITFGLCDQNGALYVGGYPKNNAASDVIYTPMATLKQSPYIAVAMEGMSVGKNDIGASLNDFGYSIVDTGTTALIFPPAVYQAIASGISDQTNGAITQDFFDQGNCVQLDSTTVSDLNDQAPPLQFDFYNAANTTTVNTLTTPASNSYLIAQSDGNGGLIVCPDMVNAGSDNPQTLLGNTIMRGFLTIFDYKQQQVGFSVSQNICKS